MGSILTAVVLSLSLSLSLSSTPTCCERTNGQKVLLNHNQVPGAPRLGRRRDLGDMGYFCAHDKSRAGSTGKRRPGGEGCTTTPYMYVYVFDGFSV